MGFWGSSSSALEQSFKASLYCPFEIYAAARLLRYVAEEGCASTATVRDLSAAFPFTILLEALTFGVFLNSLFILLCLIKFVARSLESLSLLRRGTSDRSRTCRIRLMRWSDRTLAVCCAICAVHRRGVKLVGRGLAGPAEVRRRSDGRERRGIEL